MNIFEWADSQIPKFRWYDISLVKLSVLFSTLFLAKVIPGLLAWEWYVYLVIALVLTIPIIKKMFS